MKKTTLILISTVILFSLINISLAKADCIVKVQYRDGCPRKGAVVYTIWPEDGHPLGVTDEYGSVGCNDLTNGTYMLQASWPPPNTIFGDDTPLVIYPNGDSNHPIIRNSIPGQNEHYPNGTESCGSGACSNYKYCYAGSPPYVQCSSWQTDCGTCCKCNGGTQWNPSQNYDSSQNGDCSATSCSDSCDIDSNPFTWDYANDEPNYCSSLFTCTNNQCNYQHACADADIYDGVFSWKSIIRGCTAECDQTTDYKLIGSTCSYNCDSTNACSYQSSCSISSFCNVDIRNYNGGCSNTGCSFTSENCDAQDGCYAYGTGCEARNYYCTPSSCDYTYSNRNTDYNDAFVNYCSVDTIRKHQQQHDFYCSGTCSDHISWINDQLVQDCSLQNGWYDTSTYQWISTGECTEKEQVWQDYRDYTCNAASCTYSVTSNRWIDTGQTRNKPSGTSCDDSLFCTINDQCSSGVCSGSPRNCADSFSCTDDSCDENIDACVNAPNNSKCTFPQTCNPSLFQPPTGCGYSTEPVVTITSPLINQYKTKVQLNFTVDRPTVETNYSLDNKPNVTSGNTTLTGLTSGNHILKVYAKDSNNNVGSSTTSFSYCSADINIDKTVDIYDAILLANNYNKHTSTGDINVDGTVDIYDAIMLANNYNKRCS